MCIIRSGQQNEVVNRIAGSVQQDLAIARIKKLEIKVVDS
jgi:hypothetical protein